MGLRPIAWWEEGAGNSLLGAGRVDAVGQGRWEWGKGGGKDKFVTRSCCIRMSREFLQKDLHGSSEANGQLSTV
jgi:hypothetical protein